MPRILPLSLERRRPGRIRPRLDALHGALAALGDPQRGFRSILVAGTNGKGSTAIMLARILAAHGVTTGLYTSPHLVRVEERLEVDGEPVTASELERALARLECEPELTFFEALTAAAFLVFAERRVGCAVLEAGMGGRWDATRLAGSELAGLTNVGTDHRRWLGVDRSEIARDKGTALAAARLGVLGPGVDEALRPALAAPRALRAGDLVELVANGDGGVTAFLAGGPTELELPLAGAHQRDNAHLALALAEAASRCGLAPSLEPARVRRGLAAVSWPGRLSWHRIGSQQVLLDGAHNREGVTALAAFLSERGEQLDLLFSCLDDKPVEAMAAQLRPEVARVVVAPLDDPRAMPLLRLREAFVGAEVACDPFEGLDHLGPRVLATGSLRLIGALLERARPGGGT